MRTPLTLRVLVAGCLAAAIGSACGGNSPVGPTATATFTFSGRVTESAPTQATPVGGARLQILSGVRSVTKVTADADGNFSVSGISGPFDVVAQADGYEDTTIRVDSITGDTRRTIGLMPKLRTITETFGSLTTFPLPRFPPRSFFRAVHHSGSIVVSRLYLYYSQDPTNPRTRTVEIWDGDRLLGAATISREQYYSTDLALRVPGGARYEIRITGGDWGNVTIESPN